MLALSFMGEMRVYRVLLFITLLLCLLTMSFVSISQKSQDSIYLLINVCLNSIWIIDGDLFL